MRQSVQKSSNTTTNDHCAKQKRQLRQIQVELGVSSVGGILNAVKKMREQNSRLVKENSRLHWELAKYERD
jgi:hypothetical protein